jgi:hypothetical protein
MNGPITVVDPFGAVIGGEINNLTAPVWAPWPVPYGWMFGGVGSITGVTVDGGSTVSSWIGPDPFGDPAEVLLVCEEPGAGMGAHFAGLQTNYPPASVGEGPPHAKFGISGRPVPLWSVDAEPDRAVFAGEAAGRWLWVIVHPSEASAIVVQPLMLVDARQLGVELTVLPVGDLSPRLMLDSGD